MIKIIFLRAVRICGFSLIVSSAIATGLAAGKACSCCAVAPAPPSAEANRGHPLQGVVQSVLTEKQALVVKHQEIPGVMRAMTMMLRVERHVLIQVKAGDRITALLHRDDNGVWYLEDVMVQEN